MSGETKGQISGWTVDTLREDLINRIDSLEFKLTASIDAHIKTDENVHHQEQQSIAASLSSAKEAVTKAEMATEKRFESVNEFRKMAQDTLLSNMPRNEADARFDSLIEKISEAAKIDAARYELINNRLSALDKRIDLTAGESIGSKESKVDNKAAISLFISIAVAIAIILSNLIGFIQKLSPAIGK